MSINFLKDTKKVIGCDLDDVLADFIERFMAIAADKYGVDPNLRPTSWEWDGLEMTKERVEGVWDVILHTPRFWEDLNVLPGVDGQAVRDLDHETKLYFPTARAILHGGIDVGKQSARWLENRFGLRFPTVFVSMEKGPLAAALKYDYFIDDRPKNLVDIKNAHPECKVFLQNASHNQGFINPVDMPRVASVNEFAKIVLEG
jgi:5'(3')-deoxyribonucleotidase